MKVVILGWSAGFQKIKFTEILRRDFGYSLSIAKAATDAVLENKCVEISAQEADCYRLLPQLTKLGAKVVLEEESSHAPLEVKRKQVSFWNKYSNSKSSIKKAAFLAQSDSQLPQQKCIIKRDLP